MYSISIIVPAYNCGKYLADCLDSIIAQSIGVENLEVIIVNDASTDNTGDIIDEYCEKHSNFKAIHLTENVGAAYGPRNIALDRVTSEYVMFLDGDDTFCPTACEVLYDEIISSGANMVFGRYWRVYDDVKIKSYSPYDSTDNDIKSYLRFSRFADAVWSKIVYYIFYGFSRPYREKIVIDDVSQYPEILKIMPSLWARIYRRDVIVGFPPLIMGEDFNFILDVYSRGKIVFLNTEFITNYHIRFDGELSITKNITPQMLLDLIKSYRTAVEQCNQYSFKKYGKIINLFLSFYIYLLRQADLSAGEKKILLGEISLIDEHYRNRGLIGHVIVRALKFFAR